MAVGIEHTDRALGLLDRDVDPVETVDRQVAHRSEPVEPGTPHACGIEDVDAAVGAIADEDPPASVERDVDRLPGGGHRTGGWRQEAAKREARQREDGDAVIGRVADVEVARADSDALCFVELPRTRSHVADAGHDVESALACVEAFQPQRLRIEEVDVAVGGERDVSRRRESAEAAARLRRRSRVRRREYERAARRLDDVIEARAPPSRARVEQL